MTLRRYARWLIPCALVVGCGGSWDEWSSELPRTRGKLTPEDAWATSAPDAGPGAFQGTRPSTNNLQGEVAGWVTTASGGNRGFVWQP